MDALVIALGVVVVVVDIVIVLALLSISIILSVVLVGIVTFFTTEKDDEYGQQCKYHHDIVPVSL